MDLAPSNHANVHRVHCGRSFTARPLVPVRRIHVRETPRGTRDVRRRRVGDRMTHQGVYLPGLRGCGGRVDCHAVPGER